MVNPSKKNCRDSTETKNSSSPFHIGDSLRYTNEGHNEMVDLMNINTKDPDITNYIMKLLK